MSVSLDGPQKCPENASLNMAVTRHFLSRLVARNLQYVASDVPSRRGFEVPSILYLPSNAGLSTRVTTGRESSAPLPHTLALDAEAIWYLGGFIGGGAYGRVYRYERNPSGDGFPTRIALKVFSESEDAADELRILDLLDRSGWACTNFVNAAPTNEWPPDPMQMSQMCIAMEHMDGTLQDAYAGRCQLQTAKDLTLQVARANLCLARLGLFYCDTKPSNVLYNICGNRRIRVCLGDLGGCQTAGEDAVCTYRNLWDVQMTSVASERAVAFVTAVFFVLLLQTKKGGVSKVVNTCLSHQFVDDLGVRKTTLARCPSSADFIRMLKDELDSQQAVEFAIQLFQAQSMQDIVDILTEKSM